MTNLRRCRACGALNNALVNDTRCYACGQEWAEPPLVADGGGD
jgi:predicted Zn-ribbon and HTH transcriptional regulator